MRSVPETVPFNQLTERQFKCRGCGQLRPESTLEVKHFVGGRTVRVCRGTKCWVAYLRMENHGK